MRVTQAVAITIILQFAVAGGVILLLPVHQLSTGGSLAQLTILLLLLIAVLLTVIWGLRHTQQRIATLTGELETSRQEHKALHEQFQQSIEDKVYELQISNGSLNREIAERIQAEEEIRELQHQQQLILNSAGEGILGLDNRGLVIFCNRAASLMLGWEEHELIGSPHHELIHHSHADGSEHREEDCPIYMAYRDGQVHYSSGDVFWGKNGDSFPVEYVSTPIRDQGRLNGAVVVFRDMNTYK